jgi:hypothetical protein
MATRFGGLELTLTDTGTSIGDCEASPHDSTILPAALPPNDEGSTLTDTTEGAAPLIGVTFSHEGAVEPEVPASRWIENGTAVPTGEAITRFCGGGVSPLPADANFIPD